MSHPWLNDYAEHLQLRGRSPGTVYTTRTWVVRFADYLALHKVGDWRNITDEHVDGFHRDLRWQRCATGQCYAEATVDVAMRVLCGFFKYVVRRGLLLLNPTRTLDLVKPRKRIRRIPTVAEVARLLQGPNPRTPIGLRDRAVLELMYGTGIRRSECAALDLTDVDLERRAVDVRRGKGGHHRRAPFPVHVARVLSRYLDRARPLLVRRTDSPALFLSQSGTRLSGQGLQTLFRHHVKLMGLPRLSLHSLRHACASHLLANGADMEDIQQLLGHRSPTTTAQYTHVTADELRTLHRRTHPRASPEPSEN